MRYRDILESCWKGYRQQGMKKKGDRMVPNCVRMTEADLEEDLKKWFKQKWVRFGPDGKIRGACARGSESEGKPKCLPQSKAHALGKKGRASAAARKRRQDPNPERRGAAINVATKRKTDEALGRTLAGAALAGALAMGQPTQAQTAQPGNTQATVTIGGQQRVFDLGRLDVREAAKMLEKRLEASGVTNWSATISDGKQRASIRSLDSEVSHPAYDKTR